MRKLILSIFIAGSCVVASGLFNRAQFAAVYHRSTPFFCVHRPFTLFLPKQRIGVLPLQTQFSGLLATGSLDNPAVLSGGLGRRRCILSTRVCCCRAIEGPSEPLGSVCLSATEQVSVSVCFQLALFLFFLLSLFSIRLNCSSLIYCGLKAGCLLFLVVWAFVYLFCLYFPHIVSFFGQF